MSKECQIKIYYKELQNKNVIGNKNLFDYPDYEKLKSLILERSKTSTYKDVRLKEKDKFVLEIVDYDIAGLNSVWNKETYKYFYDRVQQNPKDKIKFYIVKVSKYPDFTPPQYLTILKDSLISGWDSTKKEIEEELTEKYLNEGKRLFMLGKKENALEIKDDYMNELNINIVCNNCLNSNFLGVRYICAECDNFNLCGYCKEKIHASHNKDHIFIRLNKPILLETMKFSSIFSPNKMLLKKTHEPFDITLDVLNNGEEDLKGCFISPIRFGKNYLGCVKITITEDCKRGKKNSLEAFVKFEDNDEANVNSLYEGYFRLFTQEGIPFGDILYIQVEIE